MTDPIDEPNELDRLHSVEEVAHRLSSELASAKADQLRLERTIEALTSRLAAGQVQQAALSERVEQLAGQLVAFSRLDALDRRLEALQTNHESTDERISRLQSLPSQISRLEKRLADQADGLTHQIDAQREHFESELERSQKRRAQELGQSAQELQSLASRLAALEPAMAAMANLDRRLNGVAPRFDQVDQRIDDQAALSVGLKAQVNAQEDRVRTGQATLQAAYDELGGMVDALADRIGQQTGVMMEAKALAAELRDQDAVRQVEIKTFGEAERLFELRVEGQLLAAERETQARFDALEVKRGREWQERQKELGAREQNLRESIQALEVELSERLKHDVEALNAVLDQHAGEIAALRRVLARAAEGWFGISSALVAGVGDGPEEGPPPDPLVDRRRVLAERVAAAKHIHRSDG